MPSLEPKSAVVEHGHWCRGCSDAFDSSLKHGRQSPLTGTPLEGATYKTLEESFLRAYSTEGFLNHIADCKRARDLLKEVSEDIV